jgi:transposase
MPCCHVQKAHFFRIRGFSVALGRRELVAHRQPTSGPKVAVILSVVESCRRLKFRVRYYLAAILPGLADLPIRRLPDLTPAAWVSPHS